MSDSTRAVEAVMLGEGEIRSCVMLPPVTEVAHIADNRNGEFEAAHCRSPCLTTVGKGDILSLYQTVDRE